MNDSKRLLNIVRKDAIAMTSGKENALIMFLLLFFVLGGLTLLFPVSGLVVPCIMGAGFASMLFQNESRYHSERFNCVLPISRRELVKSRFLLSYVLYAAACLPFYLVMLASQFVIRFLAGDEFYSKINIIGKLTVKTGGALTEPEALNLLFIAAFAFGAVLLSGSLKSYFSGSGFSSAADTSDPNRKNKMWLKLYILVAVFLVIWGLVIVGIIDLSELFGIFTALFSQLAAAAGGYMLVAVMLAVAAMAVVYRYICTVLEYDEKEL